MKTQRNPHSSALARFLPGWVQILALLIFSFVQSVSAQILGYPNNTHGTKTVTSDETWCSDRARVTSATSSGSNYDLTLTDFDGSFTQDDWLMIIQMYGTGIGNYSMVNVVTSGTTSGPTANLTVNLPLSNSWPTLNFASTDRVQVVKISRFWNLTVTGGRVTCPAYDVNSGTGGILAVMVGNQFTMSGGYFDVSAKGFYPHFPSGGLGTGGAGASGGTSVTPPGATAGSNSASVDVNQEPAYNVAFTPNSGSAALYSETNGALWANTTTTTLNTSFNGQNGGQPNDAGSPGSATSGEVNYNSVTTSSYPGTLILGGSGVAGANGGAGGGGGGKGGTGGSTNSTSPVPLASPLAGSNGNTGENGGIAGAGGAGGGILYLKVYNSDLTGIPNNQKRFVAVGGQGANGGNGGDGGMGGAGGLGAEGNCVGSPGIITTPGGVGGYGDGGKGGNGGDAGSGGLGGTIWILKGVGTHTTAFSSFADNLGGQGGRGGAPGYKSMHTNTRRPRNYASGGLSNLPCNSLGVFDHAPAINYCPPVSCDCDEVFDYLGSMAGSVSYSASGGFGNISPAGGGGGAPVVWDFTNHVLYYEVSNTCGGNTRFECRMKKQATFGEFMDKVFAIADLETYGGMSLNPGIDAVAVSGGNTQLLAPGGHLMLEYFPLQDKLYDFDAIAQPYVDVDVCPFDYEVEAGNSGGGGGQTVPEDDILIERTPDGNYGADAGATPTNGDFEEQGSVSAPAPLEGQKDQLPEIRTLVKPNGLNIEYAGQKPVQYELYGINGQLLGRYESHTSMQIPLTAPGMYLLKIQSENRLAVRKLYIP